MDPLTIAANAFMREHDAMWAPPRGAPPSVLRLHADAADRSHVLKTLRLLEWQPENRRPFVIFENAFDNEAQYFEALADQLEADVTKVDAELAKDGVTRAATPRRPSDATAASVFGYAAQLAAHLADCLEGVVLVLAPNGVLNARGFAALVKSLAAARRHEARLRIDLLAPTVEALLAALPVAATFRLDRDALFEYLKQLGPKPSKGPADERLTKLTPERRKQIEMELGQSLLSIDAGQTLKVLMMDGTRALEKKRAAEAVRKFRAARMLCEATGLVRETILTTIALGTAYVAVQQLQAAEAAYRRATKAAREASLVALEAQALFGLGHVQVAARRFEDARDSFGRIRDLTTTDSPLHAEAARLISACDRRDPLFALPKAKPAPALHGDAE